MKGMIVVLAVVFALLIVPSVVAEACLLEAKLVNQDPYPAVPGEYVKVVFQVSGVSNPDCGQITFSLIPGFPFTLEPGQDASVNFNSGIYARNYQPFLTVPYKVLVDADAIDGESTIEARISSSASGSLNNVLKDFNVSVKDTRADFEVSVKDYVASTNTLTFEILNVGKNDVEALTIEIPKQETIAVKGSNRNIVGSLDATEDTTFSFEAVPKDGQIEMKIYYTDKTDVRRSVDKKVLFDSSYFNGRARDAKSSSAWIWIVLVVIVIGVIWWWRRRSAQKKHHLHHHAHHDGEH